MNMSIAIFLPVLHSTPAIFSIHDTLDDANLTIPVMVGIVILWLCARVDSIAFLMKGGSKRKKGIKCIMSFALWRIS
jgi:hypothetical protein